jgi:hypothetical protein
MARRTKFRITSAGDLEVILLYENHSLLADIMSSNYYVPVGSPPSEVRFHSSSAFADFLVHVDELFAEGHGNVELDGQKANKSLFGAALCFSESHRADADAARLYSACEQLEAWIKAEPPFTFWCGELNSQIEFLLSRRNMIRFAANLHKHRLLRLGCIMEDLRGLCARGGLQVRGLDIVAVRDPFIEELESRLLYLSSWLVEMLGAYFLAINSVVTARYNLERTIDVGRMRMPHAVTSVAIRDLYGSTLVFKNYHPDRISAHIPTVPHLMKARC